MRIGVTQLLRKLGMLMLYVFFYAYGIGGAVGIGQYYLIFLYIAIVIAILVFFRDQKCLSRYRQYYRWMGLFLLFQACSLVYTINFAKGISWLLASVKIVIKITAVAIICKDIEGVKKLFRGVAFLGGIVFFTLLATGRLYEGWRLGTDLLGNANSFAMVISFYSLGAMISFFDEERVINKLVYVFLFILDVYMIFLSGGRKYLLFQIVFIYSSFIFRGEKVQIRNLILGTVVTTVIVYIGYRAVMTVPVLYNSIGIRLIGIGTSQGALGVDSQVTLMRRGIDMFLKRPLFGWGIAGFQQYHGEYFGKAFYSHSNYIELLADYGIIGIVLYYSQYLKCMNKLLTKGLINDHERMIYLPLLISVMVLDVFAVTFNQTAFVPLYIMLISGTQKKGCQGP